MATRFEPGSPLSDQRSAALDLSQRDSGLRLAELVAAFSLAMDLGLGQPMEHVLRAWLIASRLGDHVGLERGQRGSLYYMATLGWVGCVADTPEVATWFGDDIAYRGDSFHVDLSGLSMLGFMLRHVGAGRPAMQRMRLAANLVATGGEAIERGMLAHCLTTARMAERIGLGSDVRDPLQQFFTRWDGKGVPGGVAGEDIALPMRLFQLAEIVEVFHRAEGRDAAVEVARKRRGSHFDPALVMRSARLQRMCLAIRRTSLTGMRSSPRSPRCSADSASGNSTQFWRRLPISPTYGRHREQAILAASPTSPLELPRKLDDRTRRSFPCVGRDCCTTSGCTASRRRSSTRRARCRSQSQNG